jgi:hypothetical protein
MGGQCALLKVQASKTFEFCAREASQIFGGAAVVREGQGKTVERLYREVRAAAIPGGSEEILLDFAMRQVAAKAMQIAKGKDIATFLVGHVTKEGNLAGPRALEHLVDTVLYFEGDGSTALRILRATKNRFGSTGEIGMFEMREEGLAEVPDASARLLKERALGAAGTVVTCTMEGNRPLLVEVQALVGRPTQGNPARTAVGIDRGRLAMLLAVLGKTGLDLSDRDVFVSVAGGVRARRELRLRASVGLFARPRPERLDLPCVCQLRCRERPPSNHRHRIRVARGAHVPPRLRNDVHPAALREVRVERSRHRPRHVLEPQAPGVVPGVPAAHVQQRWSKPVAPRELEGVARRGYSVGEGLQVAASRPNVEAEAHDVNAELAGRGEERVPLARGCAELRVEAAD